MTIGIFGDPSSPIVEAIGMPSEHVGGLDVAVRERVADGRPVRPLHHRRVDPVLLEEPLLVGDDDRRAVGQGDDPEPHVRGFHVARRGRVRPAPRQEGGRAEPGGGAEEIPPGHRSAAMARLPRPSVASSSSSGAVCSTACARRVPARVTVPRSVRPGFDLACEKKGRRQARPMPGVVSAGWIARNHAENHVSKVRIRHQSHWSPRTALRVTAANGPCTRCLPGQQPMSDASSCRNRRSTNRSRPTSRWSW